MNHPLDMAVANPWRTLQTILDGPLHPGGTDATEDLLERASVSRDTCLLDVGCGSGEALDIARQRGAFAVGLDRKPRGTTTLQGDFHNLPIRDSCIDVILSECVLGLSTDLSSSVDELRRVLRGGGRLALSDVVVEGDALDVPASIARMFCLDSPMDQTEVVRQLERTGFELDDLRNHRGDLLQMREQVASSIDYKRLLGTMGNRGRTLLDGIEEVEGVIETGLVRYISLVATYRDQTE